MVFSGFQFNPGDIWCNHDGCAAKDVINLPVEYVCPYAFLII